MKRIMSVLVVALVALVFCAPAHAVAQKDWTIMVYVNADNNLDSFGVDDMKEMAAGGGSNAWRNIICLIDREHGPATLNYIEKSGPKKLKDMGELDMGDYRQFVSFVTEEAKAYPAKHYAAVIWNHGSGWKDINGEIIKGISYDDSSNNHITTAQLGIATKQIQAALGKKLDVLGFDACLMQMLEVEYAIKDHVHYLSASEQTEPGDGWAYDDVFNNFKKGMTPEQFVKLIVDKYAASYNNGSAGNSSATQSAVDLTKIDALRDAVNGYCKTVMAGNYASAMKTALNQVQKFYYRTNIDFLHFVELTENTIKDEAYQTAATKLEAAIKAAIIENGISGYSCNNAKGMAIYFPTSSYSFSNEYKNLAFAKDTMWEQMVKDYYKKTTTKAIVADIAKGNVSSLRNYVATANSKNAEVTADLITKVNFKAFSENGLSKSTLNSVKTLVNELKTK